MESYATNLLVICGHISFGMDFFTIFLGTGAAGERGHEHQKRDPQSDGHGCNFSGPATPP